MYGLANKVLYYSIWNAYAQCTLYKYVKCEIKYKLYENDSMIYFWYFSTVAHLNNLNNHVLRSKQMSKFNEKTYLLMTHRERPLSIICEILATMYVWRRLLYYTYTMNIRTGIERDELMKVYRLILGRLGLHTKKSHSLYAVRNVRWLIPKCNNKQSRPNYGKCWKQPTYQMTNV